MRTIKNWFGLRCKMQMCSCIPKSDDKGFWGECVNCGKKVAYVSRVVMRSYINLQEVIKRHKELNK